MMRLCVALDLESKQEILALVARLKDYEKCIWLKIGLRAFVRDGITLIEEIHKIGQFQIFLDLKLYDIPNTMLDTFSEIAKLHIDMLTIHASSGSEAMKLLSKYAKSIPNPPLLMAVTALTSFDTEGFGQIYNANLTSHARKMAMLADESGMDGVVCSCFEVQNIKSSTHKGFLVLTPGIRPFGEGSDDQKRVSNLTEAKAAGSDFIVIGRPIYKDKNPSAVVGKILKNLE